ncbi:hypothetical protein KEM60_03039 [Austwickia sp. TVS 96-490-7B]|nr:hypothetical protein [Austwickia sp. TVS 96-490-7B]
MEVPTRSHPKDLDVPDATFTRSDLTIFTRLDDLGLEVTGQRLDPDRAVLACRVIEPDDWCRRCGRKGDPLYTARRTVHTGADLLTEVQHERLESLFAADRHIQVEYTSGIYQRMISAYRHPDQTSARVEMSSIIDTLTNGVPKTLVELRKLDRTLTRHAYDMLAYIDQPRTSNSLTEAVNGRLERLRGLALGLAQPDPPHCPRPTDSDRYYTLDCEEPN